MIRENIDGVPSDIDWMVLKLVPKVYPKKSNKKGTVTITSVSLKNLIKCHKNKKNTAKSSENKNQQKI